MRLLSAMLATSIVLSAGEFPVGSKLPAIAVADGEKAVNFGFGDDKAVAVVFTSTNCPVSNDYNERMQQVYTDYQAKGVKFVFVNANTNEPSAEVDSHAKKHGFAFKVYKDTDNILADKLNAQVTPEVFLFDRAGTLVYHGRIDDSRELSNVKSKDFRTALDAMLGGQAVAASTTKAFGCTIKRVKKTS